MDTCNRRTFVALTACGVVTTLRPLPAAADLGEREEYFIAEAFRMKRLAVASGDQPFGAVLVRAGAIIGYGPSRVVVDGNPAAHAERVALWDAQRRLGADDMTGAVIYSTSRPCAACEEAMARANVERMYFGMAATDAGRPRRR
jgi:tRNA(Arg) A34 adenosine deaminase TadA